MRITTNTLSIGVPTLKHTGDVALRVTGLRPVAELKRDAQNTRRMEARAASHTLALDRPPKTPTQKMSAPLHVMREAPSSDSVPWFLAGVAATMPYVPQTFKGLLPQALTVMVAARLAPLALPAVALAAALYPRQLGDASLYVPLDPRLGPATEADNRMSFWPNHEPPESGIEAFPPMPARPTTHVTPAKHIAMPEVEGYDAMTRPLQDWVLPGAPPTEANTAVPRQEALDTHPQDGILFSERSPTDELLEKRRAALRQRVDNILHTGTSAESKVRSLVDLLARYSKVKERLKRDKTDLEAFKFNREAGAQLHGIITNIIEHQRRATINIEKRHGIERYADDYNRYWYRDNRQAQAELSRLSKHHYNTQTLFDLADALIADIENNPQTSFKSSQPDSPSSIAFSEALKRRHDLKTKLLGE